MPNSKKKYSNKSLKNFKTVLAIIISIILILEFVPLVLSTSNTHTRGVSPHVGDYGVLKSLDLLLQEKEERANSPQIENETRYKLDQMELQKSAPIDSDPDYMIRSLDQIDYKTIEPIIFDAIESNTITNYSSIIDFLLNQPLNYWVYTKSYETGTWTKALLRRSLLFPKLNLNRWEYINIDNDLSNGYEIRVRFDIILDTDPANWSYQRPKLLPPTPGKLKLKGGFGINIERLVNRTFPLELYITKSISYEGENYIWSTGVNFQQMPPSYQSELLADKIEMQGMSSILTNLSSLWDLANATLAEINGPYSLRYKIDSNIDRFHIMAGLVKYDNRSLSDKNWLIFDVSPATDYNFVARSGEVWVDSSNIQAPIDELKWTSGIYEQQSKYKIPINLRILYGEVRKHLIVADVSLVDVPRWFNIKIDYTKVEKGNNITVLDYSASSVLTALNYTSYIYPEYDTGSNQVNCTHVYMNEIPAQFHMEMTTDLGRDINMSLYRNPQVGFVANLINNMIVRVANRFYRVGRYLKQITEGLLELPSDQGWAMIDAYDDKFSYIEFYQTSNYYIDTNGNYFAFYNTTNLDSSTGANTRVNSTQTIDDQLEFSLSGRIVDLAWLNLSFGKPLEFELRAMDEQPFIGMFIDGDDYISASISNIPGYLKVTNVDGGSYYQTYDPTLNDFEGEDGGEGSVIESFEFTSRIGTNLMNLKINHIPEALTFTRDKDLLSFNTNPDGYIEDISFLITSDYKRPFYQLTANDYVFINQEDDFIRASGRITGIQNLTFDQSFNGYIELHLNRETELHVMLVSNKEELTKAKMILDPLPSKLHLELPGIIKTTNIEFPDMTNATGFVDYSKLVFTLGTMGNELVKLLGNLSQNLIDSIGNIGLDFSISYELETFGTNLDLIAEIERGGIPITELEPGTQNEIDIYTTATDQILGNELGWTHGITMREDEYEDHEILRGHLYLQGMPNSATLKTHFTQNRTEFGLDFIGYSPRYDWLIVELQGIHDRDVSVFFEKIPNEVDFHAYADLVTNLEIGGEMIGDIDISIVDTGCDFCTRSLGGLYVNMHTFSPIQSIREVYISELPSSLNIDFQLQKEINLVYSASSEIEFLYSKLSKILTTSWHHVNLILHDLPKKFIFNLYSNPTFDIDEPLPLQGMPRINIDTNNTKNLDILVSMDGAAVGQRGNVNLNLQNIQDLSAELDKNWYKIKSVGLDFIRLKISDLPILDNYKINSLILDVEDLKALVFKVNLLFGVYPYFDLGSQSKGKIEITIDHTLKLFGQDFNAKVALIDIVYETAGGARIPVATPMFVNNINSDLKRNQQHVLIPAVLVTIFTTWANNL